MQFVEALDMELNTIKVMLVQKNYRYGNSALSPIRVFSKAGVEEQIKVRIDDKLSRIQNQSPDDTDDTVLDLIGYLLLLRIQRRMR